MNTATGQVVLPRPGHTGLETLRIWMTTIADLDTGQVLGIVDERDSEGVRDWLFAGPLDGVWAHRSLPSTRPRIPEALQVWLPRTAVSLDAFHLVKVGNDTLTEVRQRLTQQVHGRRRAAQSTLSGPTRSCSCAPATRSRTGPWTGSAWCSRPTTPPESCRRPGW
jgi:transposase